MDCTNLNIPEEVSKRIERGIGYLESSRNVMQRMPQEIPHIYSISVCLGDVTLSAPNSPQIKDEVLSALQSTGWIVASSYVDTGSGDLRTTLKHKECGGMIEIFFHPNEKGATCKRQVVGYEKKPIYEITCLAAEPLIEAVQNS